MPGSCVEAVPVLLLGNEGCDGGVAVGLTGQATALQARPSGVLGRVLYIGVQTETKERQESIECVCVGGGGGEGEGFQ